jgi:Fe-S cluster assembly protein SufD
MSTQDTTLKEQSQFQSLFEIKAQQLNGHRSDILKQLQQNALDRLGELAFPTRRDEDWKYTSVARILNQEYGDAPEVKIEQNTLHQYLPEGLDAYLMVFVNGRLDKELSNYSGLEKGLSVMTLNEALGHGDFAATAKSFLEGLLKEENAFLALNAAMGQQGVFVHVERNADIQKPLFVLHLTAITEQPALMTPQLFVDAAAGSRFSMIEAYHSLEKTETPYFTDVVNRIRLGANGQLTHYRLQNESRNAFQVSNTAAQQERDSTYSSYQLDLGGRLVRNNLSNLLHDSGTHTDMYGVYLINGEQHIDNQTFIDHAFPHCTSNELYKGVISDKGRGVFNGKVIVRQDAQKTNAFQQNSSLVLSPTAAMDTKPQLEIFADDVRCSHGATVGQLDESSVFYLRTRGLNENPARQMLQHAFLMEVLENVNIQPLHDHLEKLILDKFGE